MYNGARMLSRITSFSLLFLFLFFLLVTAVRAQTLDAEELTVLRLINEYRAQNGLPVLKASISLTRAADWMSGDMASKNYFSHTDSMGRDPFARMTVFGYAFATTKGENLAAGYSDAARTFNQWRNSPGHNSAMLHKDFRAIGISRVYQMFSTYKYYWTTDFGGVVDATFDGGASAAASTGQPVRTVNAANFVQTIAPDSIATAFGAQMAPSTMGASGYPLPNSLAGVTVTVNEQPAQLLYVSPAQINFIVPPGVSPGTGNVKIFNNGILIGSGSVAVESVSPAIFTSSSNGQGPAIAQTTFNGASYQATVNTDGSARAISVGTTASPNYLVMYGTGLRLRSSLNAVRVTIGGVTVPILYLGAHSRLAGVDQLNLRLPLDVRGRGLVDVLITVDGRVSNIAKLNIGN
ncbi:MAG: CAP domain-containing protein [Blastocatellia bacterium]